MIRYRVQHKTVYDYGDTVPISHNLVRLKPLELDHQHVESVFLNVFPDAKHRSQRIDYFGNQIEYLGIELPHRQLKIVAESTVVIDAAKRPHTESDNPWETVSRQIARSMEPMWFMAQQYVFPSPRIPKLEEATEYAKPSFRAGDGILEATTDLMHRIKKDFVFDNKATDVLTPTSEIFRSRRGVCQDFAHLMIGCLRSMGLPARYVSGYLRTYPPAGQPRLVGVDASHAWVAVMVKPGCWVEFDPTNDLQPDEDHIVVAYGRDFSDVSPVDGVFIGGGEHQLMVSVDVHPLETSVS